MDTFLVGVQEAAKGVAQNDTNLNHSQGLGSAKGVNLAYTFLVWVQEAVKGVAQNDTLLNHRKNLLNESDIVCWAQMSEAPD